MSIKKTIHKIITQFFCIACCCSLTACIQSFDNIRNYNNFENINFNDPLYFVTEHTNFFSGPQSGCKYGDYLFRFGSDNTCLVYNFYKKEFIGSFIINNSLDVSLSPHCNIACFGTEFLTDKDEFPLVYINAYNNDNLPYGTLYAYQIVRKDNTFSFNLIQTINIGFIDTNDWPTASSIRPQGNFAIDTKKKQLYAYLPRNDINLTSFFVFELPSIFIGNNVTLSIDDAVDNFFADYCFLPQDNCIFDDKLFISSGGANAGFFRILDLDSRKFVATIDLAANNMWWEPEFIDVIDGYLYCGDGRIIKFIFYN